MEKSGSLGTQIRGSHLLGTSGMLGPVLGSEEPGHKASLCLRISQHSVRSVAPDLVPWDFSLASSFPKVWSSLREGGSCLFPQVLIPSDLCVRERNLWWF